MKRTVLNLFCCDTVTHTCFGSGRPTDGRPNAAGCVRRQPCSPRWFHTEIRACLGLLHADQCLTAGRIKWTYSSIHILNHNYVASQCYRQPLVLNVNPFFWNTMFLAFSRKTMSQKLSLLLLAFGLMWGFMLLRYTFQHPRHQSSSELREQILDLSKKYVRALAEENKDMVNGGSGASMAGYADLKKTIAVLLDDILRRLVKLENKVDFFVANSSSANTTNSTTGNLVSSTSKRTHTTGSVR